MKNHIGYALASSLLILLGAGCSAPAPTTVPPAPAPATTVPAAPPQHIDSTTFNPMTVRVGDAVGGMTVIDVTQSDGHTSPAKIDDYDVRFKGNLVVSGRYTYSFSEFDGTMMVWFYPDAPSAAKLPHVADQKYAQFVLAGDDARTMLGVSGKVEKSGDVTIEIKDFNEASAPAEVFDSATLVRVIPK